MSNYNDYKIQLGALLDANAKGDLQKQADAIKDLSITVSKLNLNKSAIEHLKTQLAQNGIDINLVLGNTDKVKNETKQVGQQIGQALGNQIEKDVKKGIDNASSSLKSFSDLQSKLVNNTNLFNLNDFEKQFD